MLETLLPGQLSTGWALGLIVLSFFTSIFNVTFTLGGGLIILTVLLQILPPALVIPLHGIVQFGSNTGRAWTMRTSVCRPIARWYTLGTVAGVVVASLIYVSLPTRWLTVALGLFVLWSVWAPKFKVPSIPDKGFLGIGAISGFLSMFLGATGPLVAVFWNLQRLGGREGQVATHGAVMSVTHGIKCLAFGFLGFAFTDWLPLIIAMIMTGYAGTLVGKQILKNLIDERTFAIGFKTVLTLLALRLLWQGFSAQ